MKMRSVAPMKIAKIGYIVVSVLFCIAGILFIALPEISTKIVGIEIGIAAIVFVIRAALAKLSDQAMATLLEKARPEADNAFINAVQFAASEDTPPEIVETLLADTDVNPATIKASELYSKRPLKWLAATLPAVLLAVAIPMAAAPERMSVALQRILRPRRIPSLHPLPQTQESVCQKIFHLSYKRTNRQNVTKNAPYSATKQPQHSSDDRTLWLTWKDIKRSSN